ncbi:hypothetical protein HN371_01275 [Candidatus Poribacteria bacterium]|jgi:hypothetical protein|nr:hypothetical protein [Candidatus Poribacteria bacterium]MBT5532980.1 hypothetical protein [Candidatus Poribacteria bacterium]MBT5713872.1 hypothetical protein [Candidatus Poribacteria bacterium]MBT7097440.1 hypothetical protein [Candidatus Poribacteria bacterium]MBT7804238.1 hypothetical protein [Candidatus Poribacteria bacterium]
MRHKAIAAAISAVLALTSGAAAAQGLGIMALGDEGPFTAPAIDFATGELDAARIDRADLKGDDLRRYSVVWWHDGDTDPGELTGGEIDALVNYAEAGGSILLTAWAIRYATPMGLEGAEARQFGPTPADGINVGITVMEETVDLGLVDGMVDIDGDPPKAGVRVQVNSTGFPKSGDYFDTIWTNFITLAGAWGPPGDDWTDRIAAFGYWEAGAGKVFNMNWRLPTYHENNEDIEQLQQLTSNVIGWLEVESAFRSVEAGGKLPVTWGRLRRERVTR